MADLKIKLSNDEIKGLETPDTESALKNYWQKNYPGLNFSFFSEAGKISFNSLNCNNINLVIKKLTRKINELIYHNPRNKITWGSATVCGSVIGYATENLKYIISQESDGKFTIEKSIKLLDEEAGHRITSISSEALRKIEAGREYEPTRYDDLAAARECCEDDFKQMFDDKQLVWYYDLQKDPASARGGNNGEDLERGVISANTRFGVYEVTKNSSSNYQASIIIRGKDRILKHGVEELAAAVGVCQRNLTEKINQAGKARDAVRE